MIRTVNLIEMSHSLLQTKPTAKTAVGFML